MTIKSLFYPERLRDCLEKRGCVTLIQRGSVNLGSRTQRDCTNINVFQRRKGGLVVTERTPIYYNLGLGVRDIWFTSDP